MILLVPVARSFQRVAFEVIMARLQSSQKTDESYRFLDYRDGKQSNICLQVQVADTTAISGTVPHS